MDNVVLIPGFYTFEECQDELAFAKKAGFLKQQYGSHDRQRAFIDDPVRAKQIYEKLKIPKLEFFYEGIKPDGIDSFKPNVDLSEWQPIGLNERLRYYQYDIGQVFSRHFDILHRIDDNTRTFLTFIVYLNEDFEGGQTIFDNGVVIVPKTGDAILFPHELRHEGAIITKGRKTILRSDVVFNNERISKNSTCF